ncbi:MAG: yqaB 1 [Verrucomicrobiaceae bacterium]|nr:yqaB 1 [Verrucomicrobiaceae bacterium]
MLQLPNRDFAAFIFDCDGTLVDSMPLHYVAWVESLRHHNATFEFTEDIFYSYAGVREQDTVAALNLKHGTNVDPDSVAEMKATIFHTRIPEVKTVPPVVQVARDWYGRLPMAVASGSEEPTVRACLIATGILDLFDTIVTPRDVAHGKPAPDMFLLAAERMGVNPKDCLVFEDGQSGLDAAKAAGMETVFVARGLGRA